MLIYGSSNNRISGSPSNFEISIRVDDSTANEYELSLVQAIIPYTWNNILKDDWFKYSYTIDGFLHSHTIDYGYNSGNYYINDIKEHFKSRLNLYSIGFTWTILYNKETNLFYYNHTSLAGLSNIKFSFIGEESNTSRSLHRYLGFELNKEYNIINSTLKSVLPIEINNHFITLKMNSMNQTNDKNMSASSNIFHHSNIMCRIPMLGVYASNIVWQNVENNNSKMIIHKIPANIQIILEDDRGHILPLLNNWFYTLQITPIVNHTPKIFKLLKEISGYLSNIDEIGVLSLIQKDKKMKKYELLEEINEIEKMES